MSEWDDSEEKEVSWEPDHVPSQHNTGNILSYLGDGVIQRLGAQHVVAQYEARVCQRAENSEQSDLLYCVERGLCSSKHLKKWSP